MFAHLSQHFELLVPKKNVLVHQCVCIHENTFGVMCQSPAVEFSEGDAKVRPLHQGQVCCVATVQHIHHLHLIIDPLQHRPNDSQYYEMDHHQQSSWKTRPDRSANGCDSEMLRFWLEVRFLTGKVLTLVDQ